MSEFNQENTSFIRFVFEPTRVVNHSLLDTLILVKTMGDATAKWLIPIVMQETVEDL